VGISPPKEIAEGLRKFRYGNGNLQIHYALSAAPRWIGDPALAKVALLHLTPGLDGVSRASNEAERGLLPAEPTICVGQPTALDPSRAPPGAAILWLQLLETRRFIKGDAAGTLAAPSDGRWTKDLCEAYADRIEHRLASHIGLPDKTIDHAEAEASALADLLSGEERFKNTVPHFRRHPVTGIRD
jgi:phytoene dehydrogenase-like protein